MGYTLRKQILQNRVRKGQVRGKIYRPTPDSYVSLRDVYNLDGELIFREYKSENGDWLLWPDDPLNLNQEKLS